MSRENVDTLLSASKAARSGTTIEDREAFLTILDTDVRWIAGEGAPGVQGTFRGIDDARNYYAGWASAWEDWDWDIEEVREDQDVVVTRTWLTGRGRGSGLELDMRIGQVWTFRDGKVVRYESFPSWEQALEAAGLAE